MVRARSANDDEVVNLCRFIEAVQAYTHSRKIDIVAHSPGVTLARDTMRRYAALARDVVAFVGIAGGNHGTSICRGIETAYYGCNEIVPGSPWLARLNGVGGSLETPGPTKWMTIYNGSASDPFFDPPYDEASPRLRGAVNVAFPGDYHNDLRVDPAEVDTYLPFLPRFGQAGPYAARAAATLAHRIARTQRQPPARSRAMRNPEADETSSWMPLLRSRHSARYSSTISAGTRKPSTHPNPYLMLSYTG